LADLFASNVEIPIFGSSPLSVLTVREPPVVTVEKLIITGA
jgi:hypothetical protein